jgi:hypothetical protein
MNNGVAIEISGQDYDIDVFLGGTLLLSAEENVYPLIESYLQSANNLETIFCGDTALTDLFAAKDHNHDDVYVKIGGGGDPGLSDWFELVNPGDPEEYLRCKKPFACDYDIEAWSDTGWLPPDIWDSLPIATYATGTAVLGGIIVGANLTVDVYGVLNGEPGVGGAIWGDVGGDIGDQGDLGIALGLKLDGASYTAADVLSKLLTVDGAASGLDADLLDGNHAAAFLLAGATSVASAKLSTTNFSIEEIADVLVIKHGVTIIGEISAAGYLQMADEIESEQIF